MQSNILEFFPGRISLIEFLSQKRYYLNSFFYLLLIHKTFIYKYGGLYGEYFSAHLSDVVALQAFAKSG